MSEEAVQVHEERPLVLELFGTDGVGRHLDLALDGTRFDVADDESAHCARVEGEVSPGDVSREIVPGVEHYRHEVDRQKDRSTAEIPLEYPTVPIRVDIAPLEAVPTPHQSEGRAADEEETQQDPDSVERISERDPPADEEREREDAAPEYDPGRARSPEPRRGTLEADLIR